jgi:hypothetical protein
LGATTLPGFIFPGKKKIVVLKVTGVTHRQPRLNPEEDPVIEQNQ